jgi:hypothetical protein
MIDQHLLTAVQYALVEPPTGGLSYASELWSVAEILGALDHRQQRLLKTTHLQVGIVEIPTVIGQERYTLPDDWLATALVAWDTGTGTSRTVKEVFRADMHQADLGDASWEVTPGTPFAYSDADVPTRTIQLMPAPSAAGTIQVLYIPIASAPTGAGEHLQVPEELCLPVLKYGVLASALGKVGRAQDPQRAAYCEWRGRLGEEVTKLLLMGLG